MSCFYSWWCTLLLAPFAALKCDRRESSWLWYAEHDRSHCVSLVTETVFQLPCSRRLPQLGEGCPSLGKLTVRALFCAGDVNSGSSGPNQQGLPRGMGTTPQLVTSCTCVSTKNIQMSVNHWFIWIRNDTHTMLRGAEVLLLALDWFHKAIQLYTFSKRNNSVSLCINSFTAKFVAGKKKSTISVNG